MEQVWILSSGEREEILVMYIAQTYFSLRFGLLSPEKLVLEAQKRGLSRLVLADINNVSCVGEFVMRCRQAGIQPILGIDFRTPDYRPLYYGIAHNDEGFRELTELLSRHSLGGRPLPAVPPPMRHASIIYRKRPKAIEHFRPNEYLGIRAEDASRLRSSGLLAHRNKLVAYQPVSFLSDQEDYETHRVLRAIDQNTLISKIDVDDCARPSDFFVESGDLRKSYSTYPFLLKNAQRLLARSAIALPAGKQNNRKHFSGSAEDDFALLKKLAESGCRARYGKQAGPQVQERLERELTVIKQQGFCPYYLITWDLIRYAHEAGFHYVGRGSGANSLVAYALRITDVDPLALDLYFERFINEFRSSPPDFDIDFSWRERDEVLDYLFKRYGSEYVGLIATYSTFQLRACIRELGKVFGLPKGEIDLMAARPEDFEAQHELASEVFKYALRIQHFPSHLNIHAGGVLISERPLCYHTALQAMPKGFPIVHMDMYHAEDLGFHKFDILSQRGLGHIKEAVELVKKQRGLAVDVHDLDKITRDPAVIERLRSAQCIGCFYIESPAMRGLLTKLRCETYPGLVAASSIIRPGVSRSGMMREYISRSHAPHSFEYPHPIFEQELGDTYGVMVYQEDVLRIAHHFAGLGLGESDVLRRLMSGKKAKGDAFEKLKDKYFDNCRKRGYSDELAQEVWRQMESFAGYSFCKAHSASFAVESFQSLYLKTHFPHEFIVAVINNGGGFYRAEHYFHEARMQGAQLHAPCVNHSELATTLDGTDIYVGFGHILGFEQEYARRLVAERNMGGPFRDLVDFLERVHLPNTQCDLLIRIGALRFTGRNKYGLMWAKNAWIGSHAASCDNQADLFPSTEPSFELPALPDHPLDQSFDELELLGFTLVSPFVLLRDPERYAHCLMAEDLSERAGQMVEIVGYYVCAKSLRTRKGRPMQFGTWVDRSGRFFDSVHFPDVLQHTPIRGPGIYLLRGRVTLDFDFPQLEVSELELLPMVKDGRYGEE
ncbi:MAG: DNA polymerase III subunit alpha [Bacteroidota bacterium]